MHTILLGTFGQRDAARRRGDRDWRPLLYRLVALFVATAAQATAQESESDWSLMSAYGATLRQSYRTGDDAATTTPQFLQMERELQQRGLIDRTKMLQIRQGIFYLGMPLSQAMASVDNLQQIDYLALSGSEIRTLRGDPPPGGYGRKTREERTRGVLVMPNVRAKLRNTTILACNDRVISMHLPNGLITAETYNQVYGSGRIRFQTNFEPGFWDDGNHRARTRGNRVFDFAETHGDGFYNLPAGIGTERSELLPSVYWERNQRNPSNQWRRTVDQGRPIC